MFLVWVAIILSCMLSNILNPTNKLEKIDTKVPTTQNIEEMVSRNIPEPPQVKPAKASPEFKSIRMTEITSLLLSSSQLTVGKRFTPEPQLQCVEGCSITKIEQMLCKNIGTDGITVNWKCDALNVSFDNRKFTDIQVICEAYTENENFQENQTGYQRSDNVVAGSCFVKYSLDYIIDPALFAIFLFLVILLIVLLAFAGAYSSPDFICFCPRGGGGGGTNWSGFSTTLTR